MQAHLFSQNERKKKEKINWIPLSHMQNLQVLILYLLKIHVFSNWGKHQMYLMIALQIYKMLHQYMCYSCFLCHLTSLYDNCLVCFWVVAFLFWYCLMIIVKRLLILEKVSQPIRWVLDTIISIYPTQGFVETWKCVSFSHADA